MQCWDQSKTITVRIADSCPCTQVRGRLATALPFLLTSPDLVAPQACVQLKRASGNAQAPRALKRQVLPDGAPGVAKGGETRTQTWCCGGEGSFEG